MIVGARWAQLNVLEFSHTKQSSKFTHNIALKYINNKIFLKRERNIIIKNNINPAYSSFADGNILWIREVNGDLPNCLELTEWLL